MSEATDADAPARGREVWIEKYRPQRLEDVVGHEHITERLRSYIERDDLPHLLFSGPAGVGKCVTGETPVLTNRGVERIEDVVGDVDGFATPEDGLEVLTFDAGEFRYTEPSHVFGKRTDDLVTVRTRDGNEVTVTPEHQLLVLGHNGLTWTRAAELDPGERVVRPLRAPLPEGDGGLDWTSAMDGDRTFVHVTEEFATEHRIPAEENYVGIKKQVVVGLRRGWDEERIAAETEAPKKTVQKYRRQLSDVDLDGFSTTCSLAYLRELDASRVELRRHVERIQYVSQYNNRSKPIVPPWEVTPDLAAFLGLAVSEARLEGGRIKFYNTDERLLDRFETIAEAVFGVVPVAGNQGGVPYRNVQSRTLTHFLESCFDVFDGMTGGSGLGSALLRADDESRAAFLRAVFDAEAHVDDNGTIELAQKHGELITLLSYLLAGVGIQSRRRTERKSATNGTGTEREYHVLYVSGAGALARFRDAVGFSLDGKADRLAEHAAKDSNPNHDTVPVQAAVDDLCEALYLPKTELLTGSLNPDTPGRENYLADVDRVLDAATRRLETAQAVLERVDRLSAPIDAVTAVPAAWVGERTDLGPIETRRNLSETTGIRSDRLLEYSDGRRTPGGRRTGELLSGLGAIEAVPDTERVGTELRRAIDRLGVPDNHVASGTAFRGTGVGNLLRSDDHDLASLSRFRTVAERIERIATEMLSLDVIEKIERLDVLARSELYFDEVEHVERVDGERRVYDLTVPGTRNYVAGSVPTVMHNTTSAVAIAKEVYGEQWRENFLELNASDERGIDVVRDRIKSFARSSFGGFDYRIIFLDEADALCVPPGTEVVTGYPSAPETKRIEDVSEDGEPIPSVSFETNEIQSDRGKLVDSGVADFFELELADGRTVLASLTHPFFVVGENGELVEKELRELTPGDEIADFKDDVGVSRCEICGDWSAGRFCSVACKNEGHSLDMRGEANPMYGTEWSDERREKIVEKLSDGGLRTVETVEVSSIEYSHRGKAYNISMEHTPNFMLANGILTHNTSDAQSALRRTMEQFSNNTRFVLSCNYSSQIIDPIQSRCAVFRFSPLGDDAIEGTVREIADAEGIEMTDDGLDALVYAADGDMRKAINGLQAAAVLGGTVDEEAVYAITSTARPEEIREMVTLALDGEFTAARAELDELLVESGIAGDDIVDQLHRSVWEFDLEEREAVRVMERIGEADYRITAGANEQVQLEALLASLALED